MFQKPFALEEAYVMIFEEYSPFWCAPIVPGSRMAVNTAGAVWQLTYDLSAAPEGLIIPGREDSPGSKTFTVKARWKDLYMSDLRWDRRPVTSAHTPTGLPHEYTETVGFSGSLSFNAAHIGESLWEMAGFRRFYRVFIDVKRAVAAPIERSWEMRGAFVDGSSYSGSPIAIARSFNAKEFPELDSLYTLHENHRGPMRAYKTSENIDFTLLGITQSRYQALEPKLGYHVVVELNSGRYRFSYNGHYLPGSQAWTQGRDIVIDGREAGRIVIRLGSTPPGGSTSTDRIYVSR
jgi:hypothetical protein